MARASNMLIVAISAAWVIFGELIYFLVFGSLWGGLVPIFQEYTPPIWWAKLGGNTLVWMPPFCWTIMVIVGLMAVLRIMFELGNDNEFGG